jgi:uncharacterized protein YjaZ
MIPCDNLRRRRKMRKEKKERKQRCDKKRDCKPTIPISLYETLSRISYITKTPLKTVGETFIIDGLTQTSVLDKFETQFVRNYWYSPNLLYKGTGYINQSKIIRIPNEEKKKISLRFEQTHYDKLSDFAHALDYTTTSGASLLLQAATHNTLVVQRYIESYVERNLDAQRKKQLKEVIQYINKNSGSDLHYPLASLIDLIVERFMKNTHNLKKAVDDYLDSLK